MDVYKQLAIFAVILAAYLNWPISPIPRSLYEWRIKGDFYKYGNYKIFYRDEPGSVHVGQTLVCLHGFPSSSYDFVKVLPELRKKFNRIILLDFIGFGLSDKPLDYKYSLLDQADIVESLLRDLGVTSFHLLSHDYGDTVAQELIHRYNERTTNKDNQVSLTIQSLCLLNGGMFPETNFPSFIQRVAVIPGFGPVVSRLTSFQVFKLGFGRIFGPDTRPNEEEMWDFWYMVRYHDGYLVTSKLLGYMSERWTHRDRWVEALQQTSVPLHTIYGPADVINPPDTFIPFYRETLPLAGLSVLDAGIGHYPQWEAPSAVLNEYFKVLDKLGV